MRFRHRVSQCLPGTEIAQPQGQLATANSQQLRAKRAKIANGSPLGHKWAGGEWALCAARWKSCLFNWPILSACQLAFIIRHIHSNVSCIEQRAAPTTLKTATHTTPVFQLATAQPLSVHRSLSWQLLLAVFPLSVAVSASETANKSAWCHKPHTLTALTSKLF